MEEVRNTLTDKEALDRIRQLMDGTLWDGAADFLEAIADIVRQTGRQIGDVGHARPLRRWREVGNQ